MLSIMKVSLMGNKLDLNTDNAIDNESDIDAKQDEVEHGQCCR